MRLCAMGQKNYARGFELTLQPHMLELPLRWKKPQMIFVNSMSDLFHQRVPLSYVHRVFSVMRQARWHVFQVLTKRAERLEKIAPGLEWPANVWMGVSIENGSFKWRTDCLRQTEARIKFISLEPLIGRVGRLDLEAIDWVIVGGESGARARPIDPKWVLEIRDQCVASDIPFFFKQWGGVNRKLSGRVLEGQIWDQLPRVIDGTLSTPRSDRSRQMEMAVDAAHEGMATPGIRGDRLLPRRRP